MPRRPTRLGPEGLLLSFARDSSSGDGLSELFGEVTATDAAPISGLDVAAPRTRREARLAAAGNPVLTSPVTAPADVPAAALAPVAAVAPTAVAPEPSFDFLLGTPEVPTKTLPIAVIAPVVAAPAATVAAPATAHLSRREARAAQAAIPAPAIPKPQVPRPEVFSYDFAAPVTEAPAVTTAAVAEAPAASRSSARASKPRRGAKVKAVASKPRKAQLKKKTSAKKKVSSFATILAVAGFFASACIPAFAFADSDSDLLATPANPNSTVAEASLSVSSDVVVDAAERDVFSATTQTDLASQRDNVLKIANYEAYMKSGALEKGDDYPWFSELSNNQGGGLSPLNYYYRECVDFVAWRLNVDAGSTKAPFKWDWHNLTPNGGNAYQWKSNWENNGWKTSTVPVEGSVAWFGYHVSYVTSVNDDGTVTIEEYNHNSDHLYGKRTIPATDVISYLYPPG